MEATGAGSTDLVPPGTPAAVVNGVNAVCGVRANGGSQQLPGYA